METKLWYGQDFKFGLLGAGQLGRMMIQEAINYDLRVHCLDSDPESPCAYIASSFTLGDPTDYKDVLSFGSDKDVITIEIENVNVDALEALERLGKTIVPQPSVLRIIQDKGLQKQFYNDNNIPTAPFKQIANIDELSREVSTFPVVHKLRKGGYDGKGVKILKNKEDFKSTFDAPSILEECIPFEKEISVIVARNKAGETKAFPTVECYFNPESNLVELLFSPAKISNEIEQMAQNLAVEVINKLGMIGILAVEFFLTKDGSLLVNEVAPRPHNSGHHTIECNHTSQFEQHFRTVLNLPLGSTKMKSAGAMINILGSKNNDGIAVYDGLNEVMKTEDVFCHIYGKQHTKPNRKMGHVTVTKPNVDEAIKVALEMRHALKVISNQ